MSDRYIILTSAQADAARGQTSPWTSLEPVCLVDGATWVLPARVLADPAHETKWPLLTGLPQRNVAPEEWLADPVD